MSDLIRPLDEIDEWVDTTWVADHLGVSSERARQIIPGLGGRQWAGKWWVERERIETYGRTRRNTTPTGTRRVTLAYRTAIKGALELIAVGDVAGAAVLLRKALD